MDNLMKSKFYVDNELKDIDKTVSLDDLRSITRSLETNRYVKDSLEEYLEFIKVLELLSKHK